MKTWTASPILARLIDKIRAAGADTLGPYTPYPCGGDRNFLAVMGINADDAAILSWVKIHASKGYAQRVEAYRQQALEPVNPHFSYYS